MKVIYRCMPWSPYLGLPAGPARKVETNQPGKDIPAVLVLWLAEHKEYKIHISFVRNVVRFSEAKRMKMALRRKMKKIRSKWPLFVREAIHEKWV